MALQTQTPQTARKRVTQGGLTRKLDVLASTPESKLAGEVVPYYGGVAQPSTYSSIAFLDSADEDKIWVVVHACVDSTPSSEVFYLSF